jgi:hypothetical protein
MDFRRLMDVIQQRCARWLRHAGAAACRADRLLAQNVGGGRTLLSAAQQPPLRGVGQAGWCVARRACTGAAGCRGQFPCVPAGGTVRGSRLEEEAVKNKQLLLERKRLEVSEATGW